LGDYAPLASVIFVNQNENHTALAHAWAATDPFVATGMTAPWSVVGAL